MGGFIGYQNMSSLTNITNCIVNIIISGVGYCAGYIGIINNSVVLINGSTF